MKEDIKLFNELLRDNLSPKFTYDQLSDVLTHEWIMDIVNEYFWKLMNGFEYVFIECDLDCVSVYFSKHPDLFGDNDYHQMEDYEMIVYPYKNEDIKETICLERDQDETISHWKKT